MLWLSLSLLLLSQTQPPGRFDRISGRAPAQSRGRDSTAGSAGYVSPYVFEFAAPNGTNITAACGCPSSLKADTGQTITFARASSATCIKPDGSGVTCASGQAVIEKHSTLYGLVVERAATNAILQSDALDQSPWANVGSLGSITADALAGPFAGMEQLNDTSAAEYQGRNQANVAISGAGYAGFSCYLAAGTATSATLQITGAGTGGGDVTCAYTGLSATPTRYSCLSNGYNGSLTSMTFGVVVGNAITTTGTIYVGSCQAERNAALSALGGYREGSSYIATTGASATRAVTTASFTMPAGIVNAESCLKTSAYYDTWKNTTTPVYTAKQLGVGTVDNIISINLNSRGQAFDGVNVSTTAATITTKDAILQVRGGWKASGSFFDIQAQSGTSATAVATGIYSGTIGASGATSYLGGDSAGGNQCNCWIGHTIGDTSRTGCPLLATP